MKLKVQCPKCKKVHQVPATMAGKRCKCSACQAVVTVPQQQAPAGKLQVQCANCKTVHTVPESMRGQRCKCNKCQAVVSVPAAPSPQPAQQSAGFSFDDPLSDDLFGELDDADFSSLQAPPPIQPQPSQFADPPPQYDTGEDAGAYGRTWEDRIYYDSNVMGLAVLRWIEIAVLGMTTIAVPGLTVITASNPNAYVGGIIVCLIVWIFMIMFYSGSFSDNVPYARGIIGLIIIVVSYEGPWTFYLWVFLFPAYAAGLCFFSYGVAQALVGFG